MDIRDRLSQTAFFCYKSKVDTGSVSPGMDASPDGGSQTAQTTEAATMKIEPGKQVTLQYILRNDSGAVIEDSKKSGPLIYVHGSGQIPLPDLEAQLLGLNVGDEKEGLVRIPVENPPREEYKRSTFPADAQLTPGSMFEAKRPDGSPLHLKVIDANDETVTVEIVSFLNYAIKVLNVSDA